MIDEQELLQLAKDPDPKIRKMVEDYLNDEFLQFQPRPDDEANYENQTSFINDRFPGLSVAIAGNGSGKTVTAAWKVAKFLYDNEAPVDLAKYYIVSNSQEIVGLIWQEKISKFIHKRFIESYDWFKTGLYPRSIILKPSKNGNRWQLIFKSSEQALGSFMAADRVCGYWIDEGIAPEVRNELDARTRSYDYAGSKIWTLTPAPGSHSPDLEEIYNNRDTAENQRLFKFYRMNTYANKELKNLDWLDTFTPENLRLTRSIGAFASMEGKVYYMFDKKHIVKSTPIPSGWKHVCSIDWGYRHPTAVLYAAISPDGDIWIYDEWQKSELLTPEKIKQIKAYRKDFKFNQKGYECWADHEDLQQRQDFAAGGITTLPAYKSIREGIEIVQRTMMYDAEHPPKLQIFENCTQLIKQIKFLHYPTLTAKQKLNKEPSELPVKVEGDDFTDAMRYLIASTQRHLVTPWKSIPKKFKEQSEYKDETVEELSKSNPMLKPPIVQDLRVKRIIGKPRVY